MKPLYSVLLLILAGAAAHADEVYRTVQADGTVVYSDRPIASDSVRVQVKASPADPGRLSADVAAQAARRQAEAESRELAAAREEQARLRAAACQEAREALARYQDPPRVFEPLPDGGRRFLTDEEIVEVRLAARRAVAEFCGPNTQ